jgi:thioredoxin-disulfide reductase
MYDIIIVGGGPAGLSSAIYGGRRMLKTLVLAKNIGGQAAIAKNVENYPGIDSITGLDLVLKMKEQAEKFGAEIKFEEVIGIEKKDEKIIVKTNTAEYESKSVILSFGLTPRDLGVPGEKEYIGKGVSYCATCDAPFFKNKTVAVIGGGNSAIDAALVMSKIATKVYLVHRRDGFRAEDALVCQLRETKNIEPVLNSVAKEVKGKEFVENLVVADVNDENKTREIEVDGVFIEVGLLPKTDWVKDFLKIDENGQIAKDKKCATSVEGVFAAGDVSDVAYKQIIIAAGEGATAALAAHQYILHLAGKSLAEGAPFDWGRCATTPKEKPNLY